LREIFLDDFRLATLPSFFVVFPFVDFLFFVEGSDASPWLLIAKGVWDLVESAVVLRFLSTMGRAPVTGWRFSLSMVVAFAADDEVDGLVALVWGVGVSRKTVKLRRDMACVEWDILMMGM